MLFTCKNFIFSDFTWKKSFLLQEMVGVWRPLAPPFFKALVRLIRELQKQRQDTFCKKNVFENLKNPEENTCTEVPFLIKLQAES